MPDLDACIRGCIYEGLEVEIVLKRDQPTGKLTRGIVERVLTNKRKHPRGIKVKLRADSVSQDQLHEDIRKGRREIVDTDLIGRCVHLYENFDDPDLRPIEY